MSVARIRLFLGCGSLHRLAGPLLSKELRVAGRRRRSYALRCLYVLVLMIFIASVWVGVVQFRQGIAAQTAQMARAAKEISRGIVWFQFIAAQVVTVIVMSTAICDEIYGRTLSVLMTTPLSSLQVVMGKLFSRLLQVILLVATSLPLLAIVRVLGGVPWGYLLVSLFITLVTVVFVGSLTLLFSTLSRKMYVVVLTSTLSLGVLMGVVPFVGGILLRRSFSERFLIRAISCVNPYVLLHRYTEHMISPGRRTVVSLITVAVCGVILLIGSVGLLMYAIRLVRRVALRRMMGQPTWLDGLRPGQWLRWPGSETGRGRTAAVRRVIGPPMIWKELTCALTRRQKLAVNLIVGVEILMVLVAYTFPVMIGTVGYDAAHLLYLWIFLGLGVLFTVSTSATLISAERESRTWPVLLLTPLRDRDILMGKCVGVLRRCGPVWLPLLAYVIAFTCVDVFHPLAVAQVILIVLSALVFLLATGFYFGSRCDRTTEAVTANLALVGALWCILPMMGHWVAAGVYGEWDTGECFAAVPFAQVLLLLSSTLDGADMHFRWFDRSWDAAAATRMMAVVLLGYLLAARLFLWRAVHAFRRRIL